MTSRRHARPILALIAAYAVALQAVLSAFVLAERSAEAAFLPPDSLCLQDRSQPDHAPLDRMPCCVGMACCQIAGEPGTLPPAVTLASPQNWSIGIRAVARPVAPDLAFEDPQHPRAPPAV